MMDTQNDLLEKMTKGEITVEEYERQSRENNLKYMKEAKYNLGVVNDLVLDAENLLNRISLKLNLGIETDIGSRYFGYGVDAFETPDNDYDLVSPKINISEHDRNVSRSIQERNKFYPIEILNVSSGEEKNSYFVDVKVRYRSLDVIKDPSIKIKFSSRSIGTFVDEKVNYNKQYQPYEEFEFRVMSSKTNRPDSFEIIGFDYTALN